MFVRIAKPLALGAALILCTCAGCSSSGPRSATAPPEVLNSPETQARIKAAQEMQQRNGPPQLRQTPVSR